MAAKRLVQRQDSYWGDDYYYGPSYNSWWYTPGGYAVRYSLVIALFLIIFGYFGGGYLHARHRLKKGKQPLAYHRWMVRRQVYYQAGYGQPAYPRNDAWGASPYQPPPPAYNASQPPPPGYEPSSNQDSKIAADQHYHAGESSTSGNLPPLPAQRF